MTAHLTRVRARLRIHSHRKVRGLLDGEYSSLQPGRSTEFNDLRAYVRGDDVKDMDWKASARARTPLVRQYAAIRKLTVLLVVSTGRSMAALNDLDVPKRDLALTVAGVVGDLAIRHGDLVGVAHGDGAAQHQFPAAGGAVRLERALASIHDAITPAAASTDLTALLRYVARTVRRRAVVVVVCDEIRLDEEATSALRRLQVQHEVLLVTIGDLDPTLDREQGRGGRVRDADSGRPLPAWVRGDTLLAQQFAEQVALDALELRARVDSLGIVHEHVHDHGSAVGAVLRLLTRHRRARRR
jgi:uncharacterized protein (DUF58 family)